MPAPASLKRPVPAKHGLPDGAVRLITAYAEGKLSVTWRKAAERLIRKSSRARALASTLARNQRPSPAPREVKQGILIARPKPARRAPAVWRGIVCFVAAIGLLASLYPLAKLAGLTRTRGDRVAPPVLAVAEVERVPEPPAPMEIKAETPTQEEPLAPEWLTREAIASAAPAVFPAPIPAPVEAAPQLPPMDNALAKPVASGAPALANFIDAEIDRVLREYDLKPAGSADDAEFYRRLHIDLCGVVPNPESAAAFLDDKAPDKRARAIDALLASPDYAAHMASKWEELVWPIELGVNDRAPRNPMMLWFGKQIEANRRWDEVVHDFIADVGDFEKHPNAYYLVKNNTLLSPEELTARMSRTFLGVQLQCAQCHDHKFASWKMHDFWGVAAFYGRIRRTKDGVEENVARKPSIDAAKLRFLGDKTPAKLDAKEGYLPKLAQWMVAPKNPFFAKAMVNRTWAHYFGRGLVNPIDDMIETNSPSHPELLEELARRFIASKYDMKDLTRAICLSRAYQRTSRGVAANGKDDTYQFGMARGLTPEQTLQSLTRIFRIKPANGFDEKQRITFVTQSISAEEEDRLSYHANISYLLRVMNMPLFTQALAATAKQTAAGNRPVGQTIEHMYLSTLSRRPRPEEVARLTATVKREGAEKAYAALWWALVNSTEFSVNH